MKKLFLVIILTLVAISLLFAQELLVNGNFNNGLDGWTRNPRMDGNFDGDADVIDDGFGPKMGSGPYLWMYCLGNAYFNQCIWQPVTVQVGDTLRPDGAFIDQTNGNLTNYWCEMYLGTIEPVVDVDYLDNKVFGYSWWNDCCNNIDSNFQGTACVRPMPDSTFFVVTDTLGSGDITLYFMIKTGIWTDGSAGDLFYEIGIDSLTLMRLGGTSAVNSHPVNRPAAFELYPNFPNPFNPSTTIRFTLSGISDIVLAIFDIHGGLVRNLKQETLNTGSYSVTWDGQDNQGQILPSGIYLCQLKSGSFSKTQRMMLLK